MKYLIASAFAFAGWLAALAALSVLKNAPRAVFVSAHYALNLAIFGALFFAYHRYVRQLSPAAAAAVGMATILACEAVFWSIFSADARRYLNFVDWVVPAFLVAAAMYLAGLVARR